VADPSGSAGSGHPALRQSTPASPPAGASSTPKGFQFRVSESGPQITGQPGTGVSSAPDSSSGDNHAPHKVTVGIAIGVTSKFFLQPVIVDIYDVKTDTPNQVTAIIALGVAFLLVRWRRRARKDSRSSQLMGDRQGLLFPHNSNRLLRRASSPFFWDKQDKVIMEAFPKPPAAKRSSRDSECVRCGPSRGPK
jgi:hypothetical protein